MVLRKDVAAIKQGRSHRSVVRPLALTPVFGRGGAREPPEDPGEVLLSLKSAFGSDIDNGRL